MKRSDEMALADYFDDQGKLFGGTLASNWVPPDSVELRSGTMVIRGTHPYRGATTSRRTISVRHGLLDSFTSLADTSDEKICRFATRYGGLQIFYKMGGDSDRAHTEHLEYCAVWRYFAGVMGSLQRIAAGLCRGGSGLREYWEIINRVPPVMRESFRKSRSGQLHAFPPGYEHTWIGLAHFVGKETQQNRDMFRHLVNTLLGLGCVRPWLTWSEGSRGVVRPAIAYSSRSLLSQLALQLCLRLAKLDSFLVCIHCQKRYSPKKRAPKTGQRNFCPTCRRKGVPQAYALKDFRQRERMATGKV